MIFNFSNDTNQKYFESYKERNLYYKFFAGYLFNELIPGFDCRVASFNSLLNSKTLLEEFTTTRRNTEDSQPIALNATNLHVSFDNHLKQLNGNQLVGEIDSGEFADILVMDDRTVVCIEAKYRSDISASKDLHANGDRIALLKEYAVFHNKQFVQCLLITKAKWDGLKLHENRTGSNFKGLRDYLNESRHSWPFRLLLWDDFCEIKDVCNKSVETYLRHQLKLCASSDA
ncbi:MAG: hypothetical protein AABY86_00735 [Bdellovibrionota bacterium]